MSAQFAGQLRKTRPTGGAGKSGCQGAGRQEREVAGSNIAQVFSLTRDFAHSQESNPEESRGDLEHFRLCYFRAGYAIAARDQWKHVLLFDDSQLRRVRPSFVSVPRGVLI